MAGDSVDYQVRDPSGAVRVIRGPAGASDEDVIRQAQVLFGGQQEAPERSTGDSLARQVGLTARAGGPTAAGAVMGGAMGSVLPGVGTVGGAGVGALAMNLVHLMDRLGGTNHIDAIMDKFGLPKPDSPEEKLAAAGAESMAGMAGMAGAAKAFLPRTPTPQAPAGATGSVGPTVAEQLFASPGLGATSAATSGMASETVRQEGGGPTAQFLAGVAGGAAPGIVAPVARGIVNTVGGYVDDTVAAVTAAAGHKPSVTKLARDAMTTAAGDQAPDLRAAMREATELVPGAKPTVKEAVAQWNMRHPDRQIGGAIVKLQDELSGAKGIEDILPSKMKANEAAVERHITNVKEAAAPLREAALGGARASHLLGRGVPVPKIQHDILMESLAPGFRMNKVLRAAASDVNGQIKKELTQYKTINPDDLYTIRMNIGNTIRKHYERSGGRPDAKLAGGFERNLQRSIDDAIEASGGIGWKAYLKMYSKGLSAAEAHEARLKFAEGISKGMSSQQPGQMVKEELIPIPTLLHRPTMFANFILRLIAQDATKPVMKEVATRMQDPQEFLHLISRPDAAPAKQAVNQVLLHAAILANLIQKDQAQEEK